MHKSLDLTIVLLSLVILALVLVLFYRGIEKEPPEVYVFVEVFMPEVEEIEIDDDTHPWEVFDPPVAPRIVIKNIEN